MAVQIRTNGFRLWGVLGQLSVVLGLTACNQNLPLDHLSQKLTSEIPSLNIEADFCTTPDYEKETHLKMVVVLDKSGSNVENYEMAPDGMPLVVGGSINISPEFATDPTGEMRYGRASDPGTFLNYLDQLEQDPLDPRHHFALVEFSTRASTYPLGAQGFTSDIEDFKNEIQHRAEQNGGTPNDEGSTNYLDALDSVYSIVSNDIQMNKDCARKDPSSAPTAHCPRPGEVVAPSYVVVFMSDGSPVIEIRGVGVDRDTGEIIVRGRIEIVKQSSVDILAKTAAIQALGSDRKFVESINLFTIYYHHPTNIEIPAGELLAEMADVGEGIFYDVATGESIDYNRFEPPKKLVREELEEVYVTNQSVVWWEDGQLYPDTDHDGLPDYIERQVGLNPERASSLGDGIGDLVRYRAVLPRNLSASDIRNLCTSVPIQFVGGQSTYRASDISGLNDCEKILLNNSAGIGLADSNFDLIPDGLQFRNNVAFQVGTTPAIHQILNDGLTLAYKMSHSLPTAVPFNKLRGVKPSKYFLNRTKSTAEEGTCYNLKVTDLPFLGGENRIRLDLVLKNELERENYIYRATEQVLPPDVIDFTFPTEIEWQQ